MKSGLGLGLIPIVIRSANDGQIMVPSPKSNTLKRTAIYRETNHHWNNYPLNIRKLNSKVSFKHHLRMHYLNIYYITIAFIHCMNAIVIV